MRPAPLKKAGPMPNQFAIVSAWAGFVVVLLYANLFEYAFHRWLMHRLHRYISQPYETHVRLHHRVFRWRSALPRPARRASQLHPL